MSEQIGGAGLKPAHGTDLRPASSRDSSATAEERNSFQISALTAQFYPSWRVAQTRRKRFERFFCELAKGELGADLKRVWVFIIFLKGTNHGL